jgi:Flp pilus assembly protein TadB
MNSLSIACLLVALAIPLASRAGVPRMRLAWLTGHPMPGTRKWTRITSRNPRPLLPIAAGSLTAAALGGLPGVVTGTVAAAMIWWFLRRARQPPTTDLLTVAATWDLLAACLRAGLPVPTAITAVADQLPPHVATGLKESADLLALGADPDTAWSPATSCPDTAALARGARRASQSGTALADLVTDLAATARTHATDTAEETAQRAGVLIAAPLGLCFLPAFVCLGIVPVIAGLAKQISL